MAGVSDSLMTKAQEIEILLAELEAVKEDRARLLQIFYEIHTQFWLRKEELDKMADKVEKEDG